MLGNLQIGSINGVGFMPVNLVINPEFTVNQRGAASRTAATGYNYDRWYYDGSSLLQGIENSNLRATTYVVSWSGSATCSYSLNTAASSSQGSQTYTSITNGGTLTISSLGSNNLWIKFSGTLTDLTNVMVVPSAAQTPFIARQHPQELALCQRYCEIGDVNVIGAYVVATVVVGASPFKVTKRASPTLTYSGTPAIYVNGTIPTGSSPTTDGTPTVDLFNPRVTSTSATGGLAARLYNYQFVATAEL